VGKGVGKVWRRYGRGTEKVWEMHGQCMEKAWKKRGRKGCGELVPLHRLIIGTGALNIPDVGIIVPTSHGLIEAKGTQKTRYYGSKRAS
jgi:hypothetical protein